MYLAKHAIRHHLNVSIDMRINILTMELEPDVLMVIFIYQYFHNDLTVGTAETVNVLIEMNDLNVQQDST